MTEQNDNRLKFNLIKSWVQRHLKQKNSLLSCNNRDRKVIINTLTGNKTVEIPIKQSNSDEAWANAWIKVYNICLHALEEKVQFLCLNDPIVTHVSGSKIRVGEEMIVLPPEADEITYINSLESIVSLYEKTKALEKAKLKEKLLKKPIVVKCSTIKIEQPSLTLEKEAAASVKKEAVSKVDIPKEPVKKEKMPIKETITKITKQIIGQKVSDDDLLKKGDCRYFKEHDDPFVLITCTDLSKGESVFVQNADLCKEENVPMGAFISGKAVNLDQANNELKKMGKLFENYTFVGPIVYEINNAFVRDNKREKIRIINVIDTIVKITEELSNNKYNPIICMDNDTHKIIKDVNEEVRPDFKFKYPHVLRILPREKDEVDVHESTVLMDPIFDYDIVTINNPNFEL